MVELLLDARALLGESPRWNGADGRLYWVDIDAHRIHCTDHETGAAAVMQLDQPVGCVARRAYGGLIPGLMDGCALVDDWGQPPRRLGPRIGAGLYEQRCHTSCGRRPGDMPCRSGTTH